MAIKYDLPLQYGDELKQFQDLSFKGNTRTNTGSLSYTSATSSTVYDSTTGEEGLYTQLYNLLIAYIISTNDWNGLSDIFVANKGNVPSFQSGNESDIPMATLDNKDAIFITKDTKKIYQSTGSAWDIRGGTSTITENFITKTFVEIDANDNKFSGNKKADSLCWSEQCVYANTPMTGSIELTQLTLDNLRFGNYALIIRMRSANNSITTDAIKLDVQKNINGTFTSISTRNIKPTEFININDYKCFYVNFEYKGVKASNNQLKLVITLLTQSSAYEVGIDYIQIMPVGLGAFINA